MIQWIIFITSWLIGWRIIFTLTRSQQCTTQIHTMMCGSCSNENAFKLMHFKHMNKLRCEIFLWYQHLILRRKMAVGIESEFWIDLHTFYVIMNTSNRAKLDIWNTNKIFTGMARNFHRRRWTPAWWEILLSSGTFETKWSKNLLWIPSIHYFWTNKNIADKRHSWNSTAFSSLLPWRLPW